MALHTIDNQLTPNADRTTVELLHACKIARAALSDLNGRIPRIVWNDLFDVAQTLDLAIQNAKLLHPEIAIQEDR